MKARHIALVAVALIAAAGLLLVGSASAATKTPPPTVQTQVYADGSYATLMIDGGTAPTMGTAAVAAAAPCGNYGHDMTVKLYNVFGWVMWTYHSHFGVHVCNGKVQSLVSLYDEPIDTALGWSWCGSIVRTWTNNSTSAHSYTKGCFDVVDKLVDGRYPWAKITTGWNGNLWADDWGIG